MAKKNPVKIKIPTGLTGTMGPVAFREGLSVKVFDNTPGSQDYRIIKRILANCGGETISAKKPAPAKKTPPPVAKPSPQNLEKKGLFGGKKDTTPNGGTKNKKGKKGSNE